MTVGIITEDFTQFTVPAILEGAIETLEKNGYNTVVSDLRLYTRWKNDGWFDNGRLVGTIVEPAIRQMTELRVDGILYVAGHGRHIDLPQPGGTPVVLSYSYPTDPLIPFTVIDDVEAAESMTRFLIERGHRRIALITGMPDNIHTRLRLEGYHNALGRAGIPYVPELVIPSTWTQEGGYAAAAKALEQQPTAIFCMNDKMAGGVYELCQERGIEIGKDISVVGFDNESISSYMIPKLTTMEIPLYRFGRTAAVQLLGKMGKMPNQIELPFDAPLDTNEKYDRPSDRGDGVRMHCALMERDSVVDLRYKAPADFRQRREGVEYAEPQLITYPSTVTGTDRKANVILPPHYDPDKHYPVLYLLHGIGGDENEWLGGDPAIVLGNLMAEGRCREMITILPNVRARADGRMNPPDTCEQTNFDAFDRFIEDLRKCLMPFVEKNYPVLKGRENTAIAGLSMGGRESLFIGTHMAETFGYIGAFEPAPGLIPVTEGVGGKCMMTRSDLKLPDKYRDNTLLMIIKGRQDTVVMENPRVYHEAFAENGQPHIYFEMAGGHWFDVWSEGLWNFARKLF